MREVRWSNLAAAIGIAGAVSACVPTTRTPDRLYPIAYEMETIQSRAGRLADDYYALGTSADQAKRIRNEIVAQRMYAIDIQYTQYEAALTRESQEVGFAALTAAGGLTTASTLVASAATKTVLSAVATAVLGTKSHYESEILLAQTIRTIQKQMRASRNFIAANIAGRINQSAFEYPLAAALSDVEDYYNAGTLTTGVIDTSTTVGAEEDKSKAAKADVTQAPAEARNLVLEQTKDVTPTRVVTVVQPQRVVVATRGVDGVSAILRSWLSPNGTMDASRRSLLRDYAVSLRRGLQITTFLDASEFASDRLKFARAQGLVP